ncbi:MAG: FAD-dependent monooxygenase [Gammaproteobacteria bacterium]
MSVLIAGGGAVGAALALAAAREMPAALLSAPLRPAGRFFALGKTAADFLISAAGKPLPDNTPVRRFLLCAGGRRQYLDDDGAPLCRIIAEDALLAWLEEGLRGSAVVLHGEAQIAAARVADGAVFVALEDGRELSAELLAVADGARSPAARVLHTGAAASVFGQRAVAAAVTARGLEDDTAGQWFSRRNILALLPAGGGRFALVWSMPEAEARALEAQGAEAVAAAAVKRAGLSIAAEGAPRGFPLAAVRRAVRVLPRAAFVGDAAQTIHPLAGQGLNAGLADADLLLRCWRQKDAAAAALADYAAGGARRGAVLHGGTAALNLIGGLAAPFFAAAAMPPLNRWIARAANS